MHTSVRGLIKKEDGIILIHRIKKREDGTYRDYYVVPGGKMEKDETELETVTREIYEELGIKVKPIQKFFELNSEYDDSIQKFYICEYLDGNLGTGTGPEFTNKTEYTGVFEIKIVKLDEIEKINLVPEEIKNEIIKEGLFYEKKV